MDAASASNTLRAVAGHLTAAPSPAASANGVTELPPIGLHGPLPSPPAQKFLRPKEEWAGLAEADATTWFTNHRGKPGLPLLEDDYLFQDASTQTNGQQSDDLLQLLARLLVFSFKLRFH